MTYCEEVDEHALGVRIYSVSESKNLNYGMIIHTHASTHTDTYTHTYTHTHI